MKNINEELKNLLKFQLETLGEELIVKRSFKYVIHEGFINEPNLDIEKMCNERIMIHSHLILRQLNDLKITGEIELIIEELNVFESEDFDGYVMTALITASY